MILTAVLILFGAVCFLYPAVSNIVNEQFNESRIDEYTDNVDAISQNEINRYFSVAEKYNTALAEDVSDGNSDVSVLSDYENILNLDDGVMGYVEIPSIAVRLPIYHGESEDILEKGAAHLEHTSFPIGGENTHACISAHCGYPTQKFFDDIDEHYVHKNLDSAFFHNLPRQAFGALGVNHCEAYVQGAGPVVRGLAAAAERLHKTQGKFHIDMENIRQFLLPKAASLLKALLKK